ncbi:hypothetical protein C1646_710098 [Rhizophagus diaphanus]|nr:hypothetical protein C1646_710098 [Rhizophagus diaphanus] [Rhizophagus sp. MUCL 43196]
MWITVYEFSSKKSYESVNLPLVITLHPFFSLFFTFQSLDIHKRQIFFVRITVQLVVEFR